MPRPPEPLDNERLDLLLRSQPLLNAVESAIGLGNPFVRLSIKLQQDAGDLWAENYRSGYEPVTNQRLRETLAPLYVAYLRTGEGIHTIELTQLMDRLGVLPPPSHTLATEIHPAPPPQPRI